MTDLDPKARIRQFLTTNFYVPDESSLTDDTSLLDAGIVDSTGVMEVVAFLESDLGVKVDDAEMVPENLDSIAALVAFVAKKQG